MRYTRQLVEANKERCPEYIIKDAHHMDITDVVYVIGNLKGIDMSKNPEKTFSTVLELIHKFIDGKKKPDRREYEGSLAKSCY